VTDHYLYGAYYPVGGPAEMAKHMVAVIERHGGKVLVRASVEEILVDNKMVMGVRIGTCTLL
jgi:phytoene dehydrogenase-like protein